MILNQNSLDPPHIWDKWVAAGRGQYEESSPALITPRFRHNKTQLRFTPVLNHIFHLSSFRDPHSLVSLARLGHIEKQPSILACRLIFGSVKELKESQSSFVRSSVRSSIRSSGPSLSRALILHLLASDS